jgi:hypothetical protein
MWVKEYVVSEAGHVGESALARGEPFAQEADRLHPYLRVAMYEVLVVLPPEDEHRRRGPSRKATLPYNGPVLDHGDGEARPCGLSCSFDCL